jgi:hypothetical protein
MKNRISFWALAALLTVWAASAPAAFRWEDENTLILSDHGVKIERPDERWRVLEPSYPALVEMRFLRAGQNAVLTLKDVANVPPKNWRSATKPDKEMQRLIEPYDASGWSFYKTERTGDDVYAEGTDSLRRILMLHFHRKTESRHGDGWFVVEMVFPRELYPDLKSAFERAAASLSETSATPL